MGAMFEVGYSPPNTPPPGESAFKIMRRNALFAAFTAEPRVGYSAELRSTQIVWLVQISQV